MFRKMKRNERQLSESAVTEILESEDWGVLSVHGDDGFPYGVPINYAYVDGCIYLHCTSATSHKLDGIRRCEKVCFTIVPKHKLNVDDYSCDYQSVIVFGIATIIDDPEEKSEVMHLFMNKLAPEVTEAALNACNPKSKGLSMIRIEPVHITGKQR